MSFYDAGTRGDVRFQTRPGMPLRFVVRRSWLEQYACFVFYLYHNVIIMYSRIANRRNRLLFCTRTTERMNRK